MQTPNTKHPATSKTLWFNAVVVTLTGIMAGIAPIGEALQPVLSPAGFMLFTTVVGLINTALRFLTTTGLSTGKRR